MKSLGPDVSLVLRTCFFTLGSFCPQLRRALRGGYQPVFLGARADIPSEECTTAQLKYRAEPTEVAA